MSCFSSIGKKQIMALTGLALCGFLVTHLAGNFLIFCGAEAFNTYAHVLTSNSLIYFAEAILAVIFLTHIFLAILLTWQNKVARGQRYYLKRPTGRGATLASASMPITGLITLVFLVLHLLHFKFGPNYSIVHSGVEMRDLYRLLVEYFASHLNVLWYVFAQMALGLHVSHGLPSAFQSLGCNHPGCNKRLKIIGKIFALLIVLGFSSLPLYLHIKGGS